MRHYGKVASLVFVVAAGTLVAVTCASAGPALSTSTPFQVNGVNACTLEPYTGTGTLHLTTSDGISASGNIEYHLYAKIDGLKAVGTVSGKTYVVHEASDQQFTFSKASEETFAIVAHYVRVGEDGALVVGDDFYEYIRTHITANANGVPTAFKFDTSDEPCQ